MLGLRRKRLDNLRITKVDGVDHPAHMVEGWAVIKAADPDGTLDVDAEDVWAAADHIAKSVDRLADLAAAEALSLTPGAALAARDLLGAVLDVYKMAETDDRGDGDDGGKTKTEDGTAYPAAAYAYTPDPDQPSGWKLRLWEDPTKKETAAQVGRAVAALGAGFRGQKVEIPDADRPGVIRRVLAAWRRCNPGETPPETLTKAGRVLSADRLRRLLHAHSVLGSVISEGMTQTDPTLGGTQGDTEPDADDATAKSKKEGRMPIDREALDPEVRKELETVEAERDAAVAKAAAAEAGAADAADPLAKALESLPEPVRKHLSDLRATAEEAQKVAKAEREAREDAEYLAKARTLGVAGPKGVDAFAKALRKAAGDPEVYETLEGLARQNAALAAEAGIFKSIGQMSDGERSAWEAIEAKAAELLTKASGPLTKEQAIARVTEADPDLAKRYYAEIGVHGSNSNGNGTGRY